jgi:hypothetical protein
MTKGCRECGAKEKLVMFQDMVKSTPEQVKYFYLCAPCWKKDLGNEGLTYSDIAGW